MATSHEVKFERDTHTGKWRAICSCLWTHYGTKDECWTLAATHDLEWVEVERDARKE